MEKEMRSERIPEIDSIEELAQFWDRHDLTDFEDDLEEVTEPVFVRGESVTVPIKLNAEDVQALKRIAESRGVEEKLSFVGGSASGCESRHRTEETPNKWLHQTPTTAFS